MCKTKQYSQTAAGFYTSCFLQKFYLNLDEKHLFFFFFLCMKIPTMWDDNKRALFLCTVKEKKNTTYVWSHERSVVQKGAKKTKQQACRAVGNKEPVAKISW